MKTAQILNRRVLGVPFTQNHKTEMVNLTQFVRELTSIESATSNSLESSELEVIENVEDSNSLESNELESSIELISSKSVSETDLENSTKSIDSNSPCQGDLEVYENIEDSNSSESDELELGKQIGQLQHYWNSPKTIALMTVIAEEEGLNEDQIKTSKRGKYGGTWVHPLIFVDFLMWISPEFHYAGLKLIYDNVIKYRDAGGNSFKKVNAALLDNGYIKSGFEYSQLAKEVGQRCNAPTLIEDKPNGKQKIKYDWNSARQDILERRDELQTKLVGLINLKIMPDVRAIIESIDKL